MWREPQNADQNGRVGVGHCVLGFVRNGNTLCMRRLLSMQWLCGCERIKVGDRCCEGDVGGIVSAWCVGN